MRLRSRITCWLALATLTACAGTKPPTPADSAPIRLITVADGATDSVTERAVAARATGILLEVGYDVSALGTPTGKLQRIARVELDEIAEIDRPAFTTRLRQWLQRHDVEGIHINAASTPAGAVEALAAEVRLVRDYLSVTSNLATSASGMATLTAKGDGTWLLQRSPSTAPTMPIALTLLGESPPTTVTLAGRSAPLQTDGEGRMAWLSNGRPDTLRLVVNGDSVHVPTQRWSRPYDYALSLYGKTHRVTPWVELRRGPGPITTAASYEILGRTDSLAQAQINGVSTHVYRTGVFFDSVELAPGRNRLQLQATSAEGEALYAVEILHEPHVDRAPLPLWIDEKSLSPSEDLELLPTDVVDLRFTGAIGHRGSVRVEPGGLELAMSRQDQTDRSLYSAQLPVRRLRPGRSYRLRVELRSSGGDVERRDLSVALKVNAGVDEFPLLRTTRPRCPVSYSLGRVRLGGPFLAEYGAGIVLQSSGRFGRYQRIDLGPNRVGYIHQRYVEVLPPETVRPGFHISSLHARPRDTEDVVSIPWPEPVPYSVQGDPEGQRILVTLYGVQTTSTWVQQRGGMRYVQRMSWEQLDAQTYRVAIHLTTPLIWGYELKPEGKSLVLRLPYPTPLPEPAASDSVTHKPLSDLRVAIEAGHGGTNTGAVGLSGLFEKDVNLDTSLRLGRLCEMAGAEVVQLRTQDSGTPYMGRLDSLEASGADLVVSIHANSAGGGFLRASGTSMYYHNPFWEPFAQRVYDRMLELGYEEFGVVGSFNYRNIRLSSRPAVLVEQAFMSHARDEEQLADPAHRQRIAEKVLSGIVDYVQDLRESERLLGPLPPSVDEDSVTPAAGL